MVLRIEFRNMMLFYGRTHRVDVLVPSDKGHVCLLRQNASGKKVELDGALIEILRNKKVVTGKVKTFRGEFLIHMKDALGKLLTNPVPRKDTLAFPLPSDVSARFVLGGPGKLEAFEAVAPFFPKVPVARWTFTRPPASHTQKLTDRVWYSLPIPANSKDKYEIRVTTPDGKIRTFDLAEGTEFTVDNRDVPKPDPGKFNVLEEFASLYGLLNRVGAVQKSSLPLPTSPDLPVTKPAGTSSSPTPGVPICGSGFCGTEN